MADLYGQFQTPIDGPAVVGQAITLSGDTVLAQPSRGIWVGGSGTVVVNFINGGTNISIVGVPAGTLLPFRVSKIYSSGNGTTATSIVALS